MTGKQEYDMAPSLGPFRWQKHFKSFGSETDNNNNNNNNNYIINIISIRVILLDPWNRGKQLVKNS